VDLLLSDVLLPNQNGFEVANQIHARSPHIPIVFMSGYYDQAVAEAAHLDISSTILQKPFAMADLWSTCARPTPPPNASIASSLWPLAASLGRPKARG
jgi:DNA-binding NtrC family response regulator